MNPDRMYDLVAVVIHCGSGPNRGHYISIVKSCGFWLIFDDDIVDVSTYIRNNFCTTDSLTRKVYLLCFFTGETSEENRQINFPSHNFQYLYRTP